MKRREFFGLALLLPAAAGMTLYEFVGIALLLPAAAGVTLYAHNATASGGARRGIT